MATDFGLTFCLLFGCIFMNLYRISSSKNVTLLDTTRESKLEWKTSGDGWTEATHNENSKPTRIYTVCQVTKPNVDNWLRIPYIQRRDAQSLYIELVFTMRSCGKHGKPQDLLQCKETFNLFYYEAESDFANNKSPTWDALTYSKITKIAAEYMWSDPNTVKAEFNNKTFSRAITRKGVYFAIQDTGSCMMLYSVRVYYKTCDKITRNLAYFSSTPTGKDTSSVVEKEGICVENASVGKKPALLCHSDGEWGVKSYGGQCQCMAGYQPDHAMKQCIACQVNYYKWPISNDDCIACPAHSFAPDRGSKECKCLPNYYRRSDEPKSADCTQPPSNPRELSIKASNEDTVELTWHVPSYLGGRTDLWYSVETYQCSSSDMCSPVVNELSYSPGRTRFNSTVVVIRHLASQTLYKVIVYAHNGVSSVTKNVRSTQITFTSEVFDTKFNPKTEVFNILEVGDTYVTLGWDTNVHSKTAKAIDLYEVFYYPQSFKTNFTIVKTNLTNYTFRRLKKSTNYGFKIRGKLISGWSNFSKPVYIMTGKTIVGQKPQEETDSMSTGIIAGAIVAVFLCMAIAVVMILILVRRNREGCGEKNVSECDNLQYTNVLHCTGLDVNVNGGLTVPLFQPPGVIKTYVDPHTYEDPNQAVREFAREIDSSCITIEAVIGGGEFGDVCRGRLALPSKPPLNVAIKTLKPGATDKNRLEFLTEASIMGQFDHKNVISLKGVVTKSNPIMIITEFMDSGSLDNYLRNNDGKFTVIQLVGMMHGVAAGMKYLSDMGYVHRDLAARNVLINANLVCSVSDFGLSREISNDSTDGAYTTKGGKIPVRWTAPEAIAYRKFTTASDVWSYGVVMWEVMSYGERPYWNWSNQDVIQVIERGYRLTPPMDCPDAIYRLMLDCWRFERQQRPTFGAIVESIKKLIRHPENLRKIAKPTQYYSENTTSEATLCTSVDEWLISLKMEHYIENFRMFGYISMNQVVRMSHGDLLHIGVNLAGHQKKIINSIQTLRAQIYGTQMSEGFLV